MIFSAVLIVLFPKTQVIRATQMPISPLSFEFLSDDTQNSFCNKALSQEKGKKPQDTMSFP